MGPHRVRHDWSDLAAAVTAAIFSEEFRGDSVFYFFPQLLEVVCLPWLMPHSSTLKIHHSNHLFHHHISFLLWPSYLSLIKILTFVLAHSDNSSSLRSLIYSHLPNPSVKYGNIHTNSGDWDMDISGKLLFFTLQSSF